MKYRLAIFFFAGVSAAAFCFLDFVLYVLSNPLVTRMIMCVLVFVSLFLIGVFYFRLKSVCSDLDAAVKRRSMENDELKSNAVKLQDRVDRLSGDVDLLGKSIERAQEQMDLLGVMVLIKDHAGVVKYVNRKTCQILGYGKNEIIGRSFFENFVPASVRGYVLSSFKKLVADDPFAERQYTGLITNRDGIEIVVMWHHTLLKDEAGKCVAVLTAGVDITDRVQAEAFERETNGRLAVSKCMETVIACSRGMASRLNSILAQMSDMPETFLKLADEVEKRELSDSLSASASALGSACREARELNDELTECSTSVDLASGQVDLNEIVRTTMGCPDFMALRESRQNVEVETHLDENLFPITGTASRISRAIMALFAEEFAAMPNGGQLRISTGNLHLSEQLVKYEIIPPGDYSMLRVMDSAPGLMQEDLDRLFEPFIALRRQNGADSRGIGLALVYGIVKQHKGYVNAKSDSGTGTEIALCFPSVRSEPDSTEKLNGMPCGSESILVVDDTEEDRTIVRKVLETLGYKVTAAANGREAVKLFQAVPRGKPPFDLMLLDMIMDGGLDGTDTYREILKLCPGQKCVIVSGYAQSDRSQEAGSLGARQFLSKPYDIENLALAVRAELDGPGRDSRPSSSRYPLKKL